MINPSLTASILATALLLPALARAELRFAQTSISLQAKTDDQTLQATYPFTNMGPDPVAIVSVTTSCECTAATLDTKHLAAGETGQVLVTYKIGDNEGSHTQTVTLITDEKAGTSYVLTFKADLPKKARDELPPPVPITPSLLYWTRKPFQAKTVKVDLKAIQLNQLTVTSDHPAFQLATKIAPDKSEALIEVTPDASSTQARGELTLTLTTTSGKTLQYRIPVNLLSR